jgi:Tfp pilus tip-associated adhesin PilY1
MTRRQAMDLYAGDLSGRMWRLILAAGVAVALLFGLGLES